MSTILPSLPPLADAHLVTVCSECHRRCCILAQSYRMYCKARRDNAATSTEPIRVELLRAMALEHPSYWRAEATDDPDMPKCIEDVKELAVHQRDGALNKPEAGWTFEQRASLFAGYLTEELGLDHEQCRDAVRDVWPEAAEALERARLEIHADKMERPFMGGRS